MAEDHKTVKLSHLVDFCGVVALVAVNAVMNAGAPGLVCSIMNMADRACIGIVLEIVVDLVSSIKRPQ